MNHGQENLWAPWRMEYVRQLGPHDDKQGGGCFLCEALAAVEAKEGERAAAMRGHLTLLADARGGIVLNKFPYTTGHLLIAPRQHVADLTDLDPRQRAELMELVVLAEQLVRTAYNPQGLNIGVNIGRCAGAGLPGHIHLHVVPRWSGDSNFMQTIGHVRVIPQALEQSYELLAGTLAAMGAAAKG
ncbi:MAG: HIT domain-containing protein [Phycisphaeraceae bacterium]|nr:HIT domain-containing protein [Phycisphaeraceae bacterium]